MKHADRVKPPHVNSLLRQYFDNTYHMNHVYSNIIYTDETDIIKEKELVGHVVTHFIIVVPHHFICLKGTGQNIKWC